MRRDHELIEIALVLGVSREKHRMGLQKSESFECPSAKRLPRKRDEIFIPTKITPAHTELQEMTECLRERRKCHELSVVMTRPMMSLEIGFGWTEDVTEGESFPL
jgi:hypothetical protein